MKASKRQKKLLRFFGVPFSDRITTGAAGWEIADLMASEENRERWRKYLFLTGDFDSDTDQLKQFELGSLEAAVVPDDWSSSAALDQFRSEVVSLTEPGLGGISLWCGGSRGGFVLVAVVPPLEESCSQGSFARMGRLRSSSERRVPVSNFPEPFSSVQAALARPGCGR